MNRIAADHKTAETQFTVVRCATADHKVLETLIETVGRHSFAADRRPGEIQSMDIRCRRQANERVKSRWRLPAAMLLPMGHLMSETQVPGAHRTTADQRAVETPRASVGRHLLPMGHWWRETPSRIAHRNRRRIRSRLKPIHPLSAADLSPHRTIGVLKPSTWMSGAAICFAGVL